MKIFKDNQIDKTKIIYWVIVLLCILFLVWMVFYKEKKEPLYKIAPNTDMNK